MGCDIPMMFLEFNKYLRYIYRWSSDFRKMPYLTEPNVICDVTHARTLFNGQFSEFSFNYCGGSRRLWIKRKCISCNTCMSLTALSPTHFTAARTYYARRLWFYLSHHCAFVTRASGRHGRCPIMSGPHSVHRVPHRLLPIRSACCPGAYRISTCTCKVCFQCLSWFNL